LRLELFSRGEGEQARYRRGRRLVERERERERERSFIDNQEVTEGRDGRVVSNVDVGGCGERKRERERERFH
jgi:hypothetical protein